jgi:hypothetical protein
VIKISKTVLSGAVPRAHPGADRGPSPALLRELAVQLAADLDLTVSATSYDDGRQELEVLHTGPPHCTGPARKGWSRRPRVSGRGARPAIVRTL